MNRWQRAIALLALSQFFPKALPLQIIASEVPPLIQDYPVFDILVVQQDGRVRFQFFRRQSSDSVRKKFRHDEVFNVAVHPKGSPALWEITSMGKIEKISEATYGVVPPGFIQTVPKTGPAPSLEINAEYYISARGAGRGIASFVYRGKTQ